MKRFMTVARYSAKRRRDYQINTRPYYYVYDRKRRGYWSCHLMDREVALKRTADLNDYYGPL